MSLKKAILISLLITISKVSAENNACSTYLAYYTINSNPQCYNNPDISDNVPEILKRHTGVSESHNITTSDGYILTTFRIPKDKPKGVIMLRHAEIFADSSMWVSQENDSLPFTLWSLGYDIWLPNERGTKYSRQHANLTFEDPKFWNFSFHELGLYDMKANVDYIKKLTKADKLIVINYSTASNAGFVYYALRAKEAEDSIKISIDLAPTNYLTHLQSVPFKLVAYLEPLFKIYVELTGKHYVLLYDETYVKIIRQFELSSRDKWIFVILECLKFGWTPNEFDPKYSNSVFAQTPSGTSWKNGFHISQIVRNGGKFQYYDYGKTKNLVLYNSTEPPLYPLQNVKIPIVMIYSENDYLSTVKDVEYLASILPPATQKNANRKIKGLNHEDFMYGRHRYATAYSHILEILATLT